MRSVGAFTARLRRIYGSSACGQVCGPMVLHHEFQGGTVAAVDTGGGAAVTAALVRGAGVAGRFDNRQNNAAFLLRGHGQGRTPCFRAVFIRHVVVSPFAAA